jgi:hypothetical protein
LGLTFQKKLTLSEKKGVDRKTQAPPTIHISMYNMLWADYICYVKQKKKTDMVFKIDGKENEYQNT